MKTLKLFLLVMSVTFYSTAQNNKAFISINAGAAIADNALIRKNTGFNFDLDGAYFITPSIGLGIIISNQSFKVDDYQSSDFYSSSSLVFSGKVIYTNLLISPCFAIPINKLIIDLKPMIGLSFHSTPAELYSYTSASYSTSDITPKKNYTDFAYGASLGARIFLTDAIAIRFFANYGGYGTNGMLNTGIGFAYNFKGKE